MPTTIPAEAPLNFFINAAAACFKPFLSNVPVTTNTIIKVHILRFATKLEPSVSKKVTKSIPPTRAVTTAATIMIKIESIFNTNPMITIKIPNSLSNSIFSILSALNYIKNVSFFQCNVIYFHYFPINLLHFNQEKKRVNALL